MTDEDTAALVIARLTGGERCQLFAMHDGDASQYTISIDTPDEKSIILKSGPYKEWNVEGYRSYQNFTKMFHKAIAYREETK
jgi:hypothetical protein